MKRVLTIICFVVLAAGVLHAKDFMGIPIEESAAVAGRPLPTWIVGGGGFARYYLASVDGGFTLMGDFRFHKHHSVGAFGQIHLRDDISEVGLAYRLYFSGLLMQSGHDDFLLLGPSCLFMEKSDGTYHPFVVTFGYGRDILFFKNADLLGRIQLSGSYIIGEPVSRKNSRIYMEEETHFLVSLNFSLLFF